MIGETVLGRGEEAWKYYRKICPSYLEDISELHKTEPYVYAQMIAGKDAFKPGEAKNSWLTGTAAWNFYAISQSILGIKPHYHGIEVSPCIPGTWKGYKVTRKFRGATYHISVENPSNRNHGIKELIVNGKKINHNIIPVCKPGTVNEVRVKLG